MATKKSISPRITDETINPVIEDTPVVQPPKQKVVEEKELVGIKTKSKEVFYRWMEKYGKVNFMVPVGSGTKEPDFVSIQGNDFWIDKGIFMDLPRNIAEVLANKYQIQMTLGQNVNGKDMRVSDSTAKMDALS